MISFIIPQEHIIRHFPGSQETGSVFYAKTPVELLTYAATTFPIAFKESIPDKKDGRKRLSFVSENEVGLCNVVHISSLTDEEKASLVYENRNGYMSKVIFTERTFPTKEFHIILDENNTVITMFPGPMAPPFPKEGEESDFWDNHAFVRTQETR